MLVANDLDTRKASSEDMILARVPEVRPAREAAVELAHADGEPILRKVDDEVVMRPHQAVRVEQPAESPSDALEHPQKCMPVDVIEVHHSSIVPARRDVEERLGV
jgi:hypothetical protein